MSLSTPKKYSGEKILAIIPARGGSKSIPRKNIALLAGKPLLAWAIEAAKKVESIDKIIVSSNDDEILDEAKRRGAEPIKRPEKMSGDNSPFNQLIFHALDYLKKKEKYIPDVFIYLQPTSPLREAADINGALSLFKGGANSVISVYETDNKFLKSFLIDKKGLMAGAANNEFPFMNRQSLPKTYMPNGAIYIIKTKEFLKTGKLFTKETKAFIMPAQKSLDIDSVDDLKAAEKILTERKNKKLKNL